MEEREVIVSEALPTLAEYIELRTRTGGASIDEETAGKTMRAAAFTVSLR
jgi:hypothetical protein